MLTADCNFRNALDMVQYVNRKTIYKNVNKSQAEQLIIDLDHKQFGYNETEDFNISLVQCKNPDNVNIVITPACTYILNEPFNIPAPPDKRSQLFLSLFCDEFERIKVRVFHAVNESFDSSLFSMDAYKAMVFIKTCFRSQRIVFQEHLLKNPAYKLNPDAYINYMLAFFIIKIQVYFTKIFKEAITEEEKNETQLFDELFRIDPVVLKKFNVGTAYSPSEAPVNISSENIIPQSYNSSKTLLQSCDSDTSLALAYETIAKHHNISADTLKMLLGLTGKFTWNGKINILGDAIYQLMQKKDAQGKPILDLSPDVMASLVSTLFVDSNGNHLSKATIRTYLQPCKADKRPKGGFKLDSIKNK